MYASEDLSKELFKLSGWEGDDYQIENGNVVSVTYSLGYLLRKLPNEAHSKKIGGYHYFYLHHGKNTWIAYYGQIDTTEFMAGADTPENAACKLAIKLFKQGVISRG